MEKIESFTTEEEVNDNQDVVKTQTSERGISNL